MPKPLRHTVAIRVGDHDIELDVTFEIIEMVERVYDMRAEYVAALLQRPVRILRHQIADVIQHWASGKTDLTRSAIREAVLTAKADQLNRYIGAIQAAVLYSLREVTEEEFERLAAGLSLDDDETDDGEDGKKKPEAVTDSSRAATG